MLEASGFVRLCFSWFWICWGVNSSRYLDIACAIECIHTYSLIHDDLPCMDNDDYRRGRLTNHKVFGPAMATLAGDGLLTYAFELLTSGSQISPVKQSRLVYILAKAAGPSCMVGGQAQDIESENRKQTVEELKFMDSCKTGCMLTSPVDMASVLADCEKIEYDALHSFSVHLGLLFQITDDLLDATSSLETMGKKAGQDEKLDKSTYVSELGIDGARQMAEEEASAAVEALNIFGEKAWALQGLIPYILNRKK
ncbi:polyprenyl synthetase family protein [Allisonella histaminiformans]|uniref:polyprenyl synthetase family protein n=1 Tax=Allisonella histaminiformans TaxID=209880 RepID=UPI0026F2EAA0|nr:farnesyl diphosphate synthase [Allisonella histaminiformans]